MAKAELGLKRTCVACGAKFYDLARSPAVCPKCGTEQPAEQPRAKRAPRPCRRRRSASAPPAAEGAEHRRRGGGGRVADADDADEDLDDADEDIAEEIGVESDTDEET